ncbi:MAG: hypothetical protein CMM56_00520, partial [Rhodospirillaceae bacterium]|nr:hypothetical protein [Rhodospirillaceae bacterium]
YQSIRAKNQGTRKYHQDARLPSSQLQFNASSCAYVESNYPVKKVSGNLSRSVRAGVHFKERV